MYKLTGTIKVINDTVQVTEKFSKREFVINDSASMYPQDIMFQAAQDKCSMLDGMMEGQSVEVSFNLRGREWVSPQGETKYFNTLDAWRIEAVDTSTPGTPTASKPEPVPAAPGGGSAEDDDLPF
jgi:hypothetical protein